MVNSAFNLCLAIAVLLFPRSSSGVVAYTDDDVIHYAKTLDVVALDETLPSETLAHWLGSVPRLEQLSWYASPNCAQKFVASKMASPEMALCVKVSYTRGQVRGWLMIVVGTVDKGISGRPSLKDGWVEGEDLATQGIKDEYLAISIFRLSKLPLVLDEVSYIVAHKEIIDYAKGIDVRTLDQTLPAQRFDDWLYSGPAHSKRLAWAISFDCGMASSNSAKPEKGSPLCITVVFGPDDIRAWITIQVGTFGQGPNGKPQVKSISAQPMAGGENERRACAQLSDLPNLIAGVLATAGRKGK